MVTIAQVQFAPWDKSYDFSISQADIMSGDYVMVKTELGLELGRVLSVSAPDVVPEETKSTRELKPIIRKADEADLARRPSPERRNEALRICRELADRNSLTMKLVDCYISWSGDRYNFAFIAEGRVDFRDLVKELAGRLGGNIRLTQIGTRDEARLCGICGPCSRDLCCRGILKGFCSITSEMAEAQQIAHRGSDRISGLCGRLKCCLSYEFEGYKELDGQLPPIGSKLNRGQVKGTVVGHHILKQSVDVRIPAERSDERDVIVELDIKPNNSQKKRPT